MRTIILPAPFLTGSECSELLSLHPGCFCESKGPSSHL